MTTKITFKYFDNLYLADMLRSIAVFVTGLVVDDVLIDYYEDYWHATVYYEETT